MGSGNTHIEMVSGDSSGGMTTISGLAAAIIYEEGSGRSIQMMSGDSSGGMTTISGLTPSTNYSIEVAAVNSAGTGVYNDTVTGRTEGMLYNDM